MSVVVLMTSAAQALAQQQVSGAPERQQWVPIVLTIILVVAVGGISFWTSRRGHQD